MVICKILLPLRSVANAAAAFSVGATVAKLWGAHLAVLHVADATAQEGSVRNLVERLTEEHFHTAVKATPEVNTATTSFAVVTGREPEVVAYQARLADLVVVPH